MDRYIPQKELEQFEDLISYFIYQRESGKPVAILHCTLKDLKTFIKRLVVNYYLPLKPDEAYWFMKHLSCFLRSIRIRLVEEGFDRIFCSYLLDEIQEAFNKADSMRCGPMLNNFDLKLRPLFRIIRSEAP